MQFHESDWFKTNAINLKTETYAIFQTIVKHLINQLISGVICPLVKCPLVMIEICLKIRFLSPLSVYLFWVFF